MTGMDINTLQALSVDALDDIELISFGRVFP